MLTLRKAEERGKSDLGWLTSYHTFSFGGYSDPNHMGFRALRVLNDDRVAPGKGFGAHGHRDMEILSYVLDGQLAHKDSMGEEHVLGPNEVQAMSAGSGVIHSEFNGSDTEPTHFFQIWLVPETRGIKPSYQQFAYDPSEKRGTLRLIAGPDQEHAIRRRRSSIRTRACTRRCSTAVETITFPIAQGRHAWVQGAGGDIEVNGIALKEGDGLAVSDEAALTLRGAGASGGELLLFDLA